MANVWQKRNLVTGVVISELRGAKTCDLANQAVCVYCQGIRIVNIRRCYGFLSDYLSFVSHKLRKEHRARIVSLACTSGMLTLGTADSCERSDAVLCVLCAICVRIKYLRDGILVCRLVFL